MRLRVTKFLVAAIRRGVVSHPPNSSTAGTELCSLRPAGFQPAEVCRQRTECRRDAEAGGLCSGSAARVNIARAAARQRTYVIDKPARSYGFGGSFLLVNGVNRSIGTGRNVVVLCSLEISRMVCRKRSCRAIGSRLIIAAACTIFSAA